MLGAKVPQQTFSDLARMMPISLLSIVFANWSNLFVKNLIKKPFLLTGLDVKIPNTP